MTGGEPDLTRSTTISGPTLPPKSTWTTEWTAHRVPDAVRAAALANAIDLVAPAAALGKASHDLASYTIDLARTFEAYLTGGQEADGEG